MSSSAVKAVVLCAGRGSRPQDEAGALPGALCQANGQPLLRYVLDALSFLPREDVILVVGRGWEETLADFAPHPHAVQDSQLGTGHAVLAARALLEGFEGHVLVCCGDMPLVKRNTYQSLVATHLREGNACTLLSGVTERELPYGRILRDGDRRFRAIVEELDCTPEERAVTELNAGVYLFEAACLWEVLEGLLPNNSQGEYYLTDAPARLLAQGKKVGVCPTCTPTEMLGGNTPQQLEQVELTLKGRQA